ncbi:MAG: FeoB-associated Cys-rich membrane protein [Acutalibacter sp.]
MGTFFTALLLALLAVAVYFAGRSIRRRKGCGGHCAGCSGCPNRPSPCEKR